MQAVGWVLPAAGDASTLIRRRPATAEQVIARAFLGQCYVCRCIFISIHKLLICSANTQNCAKLLIILCDVFISSYVVVTSTT